MVVCCSCGASTPQLIDSSGSGALARCSRCGMICDPYLENDAIVTALNVVLLRKSAWRHVIHNAAASTLRDLMLIFLLATLLEATSSLICRTASLPSSSTQSVLPGVMSSAVSVTNQNGTAEFINSSVLSSIGHLFSEQHLARLIPKPNSMPPTLQLAASYNLLKLPFQELAQMIALLFFCILVEATLFAVSLASCLTIKPSAAAAGSSSDQLTTVQLIMRSVFLAASLHLALLIFFVWSIPSDLLMLVEGASMLWRCLAAGALTKDDSRVRRWAAIVLFLILRSSFRLLCGWAPVFGFI